MAREMGSGLFDGGEDEKYNGAGFVEISRTVISSHFFLSNNIIRLSTVTNTTYQGKAVAPIMYYMIGNNKTDKS